MIIKFSVNLHLQHNLSISEKSSSHSLSDFSHFNLCNLQWCDLHWWLHICWVLLYNEPVGSKNNGDEDTLKAQMTQMISLSQICLDPDWLNQIEDPTHDLCDLLLIHWLAWQRYRLWRQADDLLFPLRYGQCNWQYIPFLALIFYMRLMTLLNVASNIMHNQMMRHNSLISIFNEVYINFNVQFNVQNAFLKSDISDDELI